MFVISVKLVWFCAFNGTLLNDINILLDIFNPFVKFRIDGICVNCVSIVTEFTHRVQRVVLPSI